MTPAELFGERLGDYEVTGFLGEGGMALVFRGTDPSGEEVALKVLPPDQVARDPQAAARFEREMAVARELDHPNVLKVRDSGRTDEGMLFYAMDLVQGTALDRYLEAVTLPPFDDAVHVIKGLCKGLAYLHESGLVHRDLKPANVFLVGEKQEVVLGDFGLVKPLEVDDLTADNERVGTPAYMSPEQFKGRRLDRRSDIYQLGVLLYRLLTGRVPFQEANFFKLGVQHMTRRPLKPRALNPEIPPELEAAILRCLEKKPDDRYPDAGALSRDLNRYFVRKETAAARRENLEGRRLVEQPVSVTPLGESLAAAGPVLDREGREEVDLAALGEAAGRLVLALLLALPAWVPLRLHLEPLPALGVLLGLAALFVVLGSRGVRRPLEGLDLATGWVVLVLAWLGAEVGIRPDAAVAGVAALPVLVGIEAGFLTWTLLRFARIEALAWQWRGVAAASTVHAGLFLTELAAGVPLEKLVRGEARLLAHGGAPYLEPFAAPFSYARLVHLPALALVSFALAALALRGERPTKAALHLSEALLAGTLALALGRVVGAMSRGVFGFV